MQVIRDDGCWSWRGSLDQDGYPIFKAEFDGVTYARAHRYSYARHTGEHPEGRLVCHSCDNPTCSNPDHLFLGSALDNMQDKVAKGRVRVARGEDSGHAILTENLAAQVLADPRSYQEIGRDYGIAASTVASIKNRKSWRHLEVPPAKGRHRGNGHRGASDKLNPDAVRHIRSSQESGKALAERYGVSPQTICGIRKRRSWKHVE